MKREYKKPNFRLSREQRIVHSRQFRETFSQKKKWVGRFMVLWVRTGEGASLRLGVVASKKVGAAHQRARAKRRLREAWRLNRCRMGGEKDVVLVSRRAILNASWDDVVNELISLSRRAGLLECNEEKATDEDCERATS